VLPPPRRSQSPYPQEKPGTAGSRRWRNVTGSMNSGERRLAYLLTAGRDPRLGFQASGQSRAGAAEEAME